MLVLPSMATPPWWCPGWRRPGRGAARRVHAAPVGGDRGSVAIVASLAGARRWPPWDRTWARFVLDLQQRLPVPWRRASAITGPLRAVKGPTRSLLSGGRPRPPTAWRPPSRPATSPSWAGPRPTSRPAGRRLVEAGHARVNFAIVGSGPNAASPHHEPGTGSSSRARSSCDFGGTSPDGYCSDITRCVHVGEPPAEVVELYAVLQEAQAAGVAAAVVGTPCEAVDAAARQRIAAGRRPLRPPHRPRHRPRGARGPVPRRGQLRAPRRRPRLLGGAGDLPAGADRPAAGGHRGGHRRRPRALNRANHDLVVVDG